MGALLWTLLLAAAFAASSAVTVPEEVIYVTVGSTVTLAPTVAFDNPLRYVYWSTKNQDIAWHNPLSSWSYSTDEKWRSRLSVSSSVVLVIKGIKEEDFGTFTILTLVQTERIPKQKYTLAKVNVSLNSASPPLLPGESASLACDVETPQGHAKPEIYWLNPQGEKKKIATNGGRLTVKVAKRDHGIWTCVMNKGRRREDKATILLRVLDLSPAPLYQEYTSKSSPLAIPCAFPPYASWEQIKAKGIREADWRFFPKLKSGLVSQTPQKLYSLSLGDELAWRAELNKGLLPSADLQKGELSLSRWTGRDEDAGDYVCSVTFESNVTLDRKVHVDVLKIDSSPGTKIISSQSFNLSCGVGRPLPTDLRLKWLPPRDSSLPPPSPGSDPPPAHLAIPEAGWGDGGKWRCELWRNNMRLTSTEIVLQIDPKLSVWMLVTICGGAVVILLILILTFILCRRRQRKTRLLKHRLCQCKNPKPKGFYRT